LKDLIKHQFLEENGHKIQENHGISLETDTIKLFSHNDLYCNSFIHYQVQNCDLASLAKLGEGEGGRNMLSGGN